LELRLAYLNLLLRLLNTFNAIFVAHLLKKQQR
jgi:hypothetical protein